MALEELSQHDPRGVAGNYGVTDMVAALQVRRAALSSSCGLLLTLRMDNTSG